MRAEIREDSRVHIIAETYAEGLALKYLQDERERGRQVCPVGATIPEPMVWHTWPEGGELPSDG